MNERHRDLLVLAVAALSLGCRREAVGPPLPPPRLPAADARHLPARTLIEAIGQMIHESDGALTADRVQALFDVSLSPQGGALQGTSRRWPVQVDLATPVEKGAGPVLRIAMPVEAKLTLANLVQILGPPAAVVRARESMVEFTDPPSLKHLRTTASLLGAPDPDAPVLRLELDAVGPLPR